MHRLELDKVMYTRDQSDPVSYSFEGGKTYLLIGNNGAGKTTLLESIAGITPIHSGKIIINDQVLNISTRFRKKWNKDALKATTMQIQHIEQYWSAERLVEEQELHGMHVKGEATDRQPRLAYYSSLFHINEHIHEQELHLLSIGQQKKAALALCFAKETPWLLLDEPLAALDDHGKLQFLQALRERKSLGLSTIIVSHQWIELFADIDELVIVEQFQLKQQELTSYAQDEHYYEEKMFNELVREVDKHELENNVELLLKQANTDTGNIQASNYGRSDVMDKELIAGDNKYISSIPKQNTRITNTQLHSFFDPRSIIVSLLLASTTVVIGNSWAATISYLIVAGLVLIYFRHRVKSWLTILFAFIIMSLVFTVVGGIQVAPLSFHIDSALPILLRMTQLLAIIMLGLPVMELLTPFRLQRALEQSFHWLARLNVSIYPYTMLISLIFRLVPLLLQKWNRTAAIARAKFNYSTLLSARSISLILIPYMRNVLRLADQVATSLELRGYSTEKLGKHMYYRVRWRKQDSFLLLSFTLITFIVGLLSSVL